MAFSNAHEKQGKECQRAQEALSGLLSWKMAVSFHRSTAPRAALTSEAFGEDYFICAKGTRRQRELLPKWQH